MKNLESFENFKNEEVANLDATLGGDLLPCKWTDGTNTGDDLYDTEAKRLIYL
jgi:hypothetical protein